VHRNRVLLVLAAAAAGAILVGVAAARMLGGETVDLLPNLDQAPPGELAGRTESAENGSHFFLGFESAAANAGDGPLTLAARRPSRDRPRMSLVQEVRRSDGSIRAVPLPATLRYVRSATHSHWHLLGFMRYELRGRGGEPIRDRKTGFCLGDRYRLRLALQHAEPSARYREECGKSKPDLLSLRVGISVGWGDDYKPHVEGQEFDVTDLPAGRYLLVHRVNPQRILAESDYSDNVSSLAFDLSWPAGRTRPPRLDVVGRCAGTATCG
jgi:hypothetical protein